MSAEDLPIVLLPGLQSDARSWHYQLEHFRGRREVIVPHGHQFCRSIPEMAETVIVQLPPRFHLVVWSMGGYIGFEMFGAVAERVESFVVIATSARPDLPEQTARRHELIALAEARGIAAAAEDGNRQSLHDPDALDPTVRAAVLAAWSDIGLEAYKGQQQAIMDRADVRPKLGAIRVPPLVIVGTEDAVIPPECGREIHRLIEGAEKREIPSCGHCPPLERPDLVNAWLDEWCRSRAESGRSPLTA